MTAAPGTAADADPTDGRDESLNERLDRNWGEILQELRVAQTGTQILTGFLLTISFQQRFTSISAAQQRIYLVLVVLAVLTTAVGLAPVSVHRALFRHHAKLTIVRFGHVVLRLMLAGIGLVLTGVVLLVFDVLVGRAAGLAAAGAVALVLLGIALAPRLPHFTAPS